MESIILELENDKKPFTVDDIAARYKPESGQYSSKITFNLYV